MPAPPPPPPHGGGGGDDDNTAAACGGQSAGATAAPTTAAGPPPPPRDAERAPNPPPLLLLPSRRCKTLHLVRHAEGFHNVAGALDYANYKLERFLDAHLTREGWRQAHALRAELLQAAAASGGQQPQHHHHHHHRPVRPAVVLTSPLTRALETAAAAFGGKVLGFEDDEEPGGADPRSPPPPLLMRTQTAEPGVREAHPPICAPAGGLPRFAAVELAREHLGVHPCDRRRPLSGKRAAFPAIDFDRHPSPEDDALWRADARETEAEIRARALALLRLVAAGRDEAEVAVVSHASLLRHMLHAATATVGDEDGDAEGLRRPFTNAELRTVVLVVSP